MLTITSLPRALAFFLFASLALSTEGVLAQNASGTEHDCADIDLRDPDDPLLTREERIALMEQQLFLSLGRFDRCNIPNISPATSASGGGAGQESAADGDMSGTETGSGEAEAAQTANGSGQAGRQGQQPPGDQAADPGEAAGTAAQETVSAGTGEEAGDSGSGQEPRTEQPGSGDPVPEDIDAGTGDTELQQRIRRRAEAEKDPERRARLWERYRALKGQSAP